MSRYKSLLYCCHGTKYLVPWQGFTWFYINHLATIWCQTWQNRNSLTKKIWKCFQLSQRWQNEPWKHFEIHSNYSISVLNGLNTSFIKHSDWKKISFFLQNRRLKRDFLVGQRNITKFYLQNYIVLFTFSEQICQ